MTPNNTIGRSRRRQSGLQQGADLINRDFSVSAEDVKSFGEHGFLKLEKIFSDEMVEHLSKLSSSQVVPPAGNYGMGFSKLKYNMGTTTPRFWL